MIILPAMDLLDGKPVRLYQGDYKRKESVGDDAFLIARQFKAAGASYLHLVDLNGAKMGKPCNFALIQKIVAEIGIPVEVGGGIRTFSDIERYLQCGAKRIILGTAALENPSFLKEALCRYGDRLAVGLDCKDGYVYGNGWLSASQTDYITFAKEMELLGVKTLIVTDISRDGTMQGPNLAMLKELSKVVNIQLIASGGIRDLHHIKQLCELGIYGAITGKALYANTLSLKEAIEESEG